MTARSAPIPQSIESTSPSRALTVSLPNGTVHEKIPQKEPVESEKIASRPGPPVIVSLSNPPTMRSSPAPPSTPSEPLSVVIVSLPPPPLTLDDAPVAPTVNVSAASLPT